MRILKGAKVIPIKLPTIDGYLFNSHSLKGQSYMISFLRFASCPFCNLRISELVRRFDEFGDDFTIITIFDSPLDNLIKYTDKHQAPFPILADEKNVYFDLYGIEHSLMGVGKAILFRFPTLVKGMAKGYIPTSLKGSLTTMPADFLIDKKEIIYKAYYGKDEGDHLDFEEIIKFSLEN